MFGLNLRLPFLPEPTARPSRAVRDAIHLLEEARAAAERATQDVHDAMRRVDINRSTERLAAQCVARAIGREPVSYRGRVYRATPGGDITIEDLEAPRFAGETL